MSETWPFVSVVIPMRNEAGHVAPCLEAVLAQEYPRDHMEVIVVDGESDDDTATIARAAAQRDARVRVLSNPGRIVPTAMNIGIRAARGEIISRVDGHTRIAADYVRVGVETLRRTGADNVGGPMRAVGGGLFGDAVATATSSRFGIGSYFHFGTSERAVDTVYMGMWPRRVFERVGLFDEELVRNQDDELSYRIRKEGGRIVLTPAMRSWYQNRQSIRHLTRQYFQYGLWKIRVLQKHPRQMSWRHFVPPAFVALLVALAGGLRRAGGARGSRSARRHLRRRRARRLGGAQPAPRRGGVARHGARVRRDSSQLGGRLPGRITQVRRPLVACRTGAENAESRRRLRRRPAPGGSGERFLMDPEGGNR
jgi:glycosyltransferase involved in cell wall biosynthesis